MSCEEREGRKVLRERKRGDINQFSAVREKKTGKDLGNRNICRTFALAIQQHAVCTTY